MIREIIDGITSAIENGRTDIVRSLIHACEGYTVSNEVKESFSLENLLNDPSTEEGTFLHLATKRDQADIVRTLLASGADPGVQNQYGQTAVHLANSSQMQAVFTEELLTATAQANIGRVCQLLAAGISVNATDNPKSGNTALHWAATYADKDMVQCLLDRDADVNAVNGSGATPLHDAVCRGDKDIVEELLCHSANPLIRATEGKFANKSALDLACDYPDIHPLVMKYSTSFTNGNSLELDNNLKKNNKWSNSLESLISVNQGIIPGMDGLSLSLDVRIKKDDFNENSLPCKNSSILKSNLFNSQTNLRNCNNKLDLLWPQPQFIELMEGTCNIPEKLSVNIQTGPKPELFYDILMIWEYHRKSLEAESYKHELEGVSSSTSSEESWLSLHVNSNIFSTSESYRLSVNDSKVKIVASDLFGLHSALVTYTQLLRLFKEEYSIPQFQIRDWPVLKYRGVLIDFSSRNRIPSQETLYYMIDIISHLKMNQLHFYVKFSSLETYQMCYNSREIIELSQFCKERQISLVPVIDVDEQIVFEDLSKFPIRQFLDSFPNICFVHLGLQLSKLIVNSKKHFTLSDLNQILCLPLHITPFLCCNSFHDQMSFLRIIPPNFVLLEYDLQHNYNFQGYYENLNNAGASFGIILGSCPWNSISGCTKVSIQKIHEFIQSAVEQNALSCLISNRTGDKSLISPQIFSWPEILITAGLSWNSNISLVYLNDEIANLLNWHIFEDSSGLLGHIVLELIQAELYVTHANCSKKRNNGCQLSDINESPIHQLLWDPDNFNLEYQAPNVFMQVIRLIRQLQLKIPEAKPMCKQASDIVNEVQLSLDLIYLACRIGKALVTIGQNPNASMGLAVINLGIANLSPTTRTDIANRLLSTTECYRSVWLLRNLPTGLQTAIQCLISLLQRMVPDNKTIVQEL